MPTYSSAIADATPDPQKPQKPTPQLKRPNRPKEFRDVEPGDAGTEGWRDDPDDPTAPQLGSIANTNPDPSPVRATDPTTVQPQRSPVGTSANAVGLPGLALLTLWTQGIPKASVFPDPVLAFPHTSLPSSAS